VVDEVGSGVLRPDRQVDAVADVLLELDGHAGAQHDIAAALAPRSWPAERLGSRPLPFPFATFSFAIMSGAPNWMPPPVRHCRVGRHDLGHTVDRADLRHLRQREQAGLLAVGHPDRDVRGHVPDAAPDQRVEVLGDRAHRRQGEDADDDPGDGQCRAQLAPRQVAKDFVHATMI